MSDKTALTGLLRAIRGVFGTGSVDRIEVRHVNADGTESRVCSFSGDRISGKGVAHDAIAEDLLAEIAEDVKLFPSGVQNYAVLFYRPGDRDHVQRKLVQYKNATDNLSDRLEQSEPATEKGFLAQALRHNEFIMARMVAKDDSVMKYLESQNQFLLGLVRTLSESHVQVLQAEQSLLDQRAERDLRVKRESKQDKLVERGMETLLMYGGPLMQKILPGPAGQAIATDAMLINLVSSMDEAQIQTFLQTLRPEQQANFIELYRALRARHEKVKLSDEPEKPEDKPTSNGASS